MSHQVLADVLAAGVGLGTLVDVGAGRIPGVASSLDETVEALALEPGIALVGVDAPTIGTAPVRVFSAFLDDVRFRDVCRR